MRKNNDNNESGIATIIAIGISVMLLMLGLAFVTTSMIERKAAVNYQNINVARALAQTSLNRAMANMKLNSYNPTESMNTIVSHDDNDGSAAARAIYGNDLASQLTTVINGTTYLDVPSDYPANSSYNITDTSDVTWVYLKSDEDSGIFGRIAYVVLPDKGKINPWAVIDSGTIGGTIPSEYYSSSLGNSSSNVIGRPGRDINEISLQSLAKDTPDFTSSYATKMSVIGSTPEWSSDTGLVAIGNDGKWKDLEDIFGKLGISSSNDTVRNYFREVFYVNYTEDLEKYWVDDNLDSVREAGEMDDRFNLTRTDWGDFTANNFGSKAPGLQWLINMRDTKKRDQIIANLIDYCDTDDSPTCNNAASPGYLGLEKVPYINRVVFQIPGEITVIPNTTTTTTPGYWWYGYHPGTTTTTVNSYTYTFSTSNITAKIQIVDMYGISKNVKAKLDYEILLRYGRSTSLQELAANDYSDTELTVDITSTANNYTTHSSDVSYAIPVGSGSVTTTNSTPYTNTVIQAQIRRVKARLFDDTGTILYDYSLILEQDDNAPWYDVVTNTTGTSTQTTTRYVYFETADPRQNLNSSDWTAFSSTTSPDDTANNSLFVPTGSDKDPEPSATYPWQISTAYIRNAPMKSPWELGFIHRAEAFQTINLKKYNTENDYSFAGYGFGSSAGGGDYGDGDANILDQIKMTPNATTLGKINLNSDNKSVLRALFDQIKVGSQKDDPGSGGTVIDEDTADQIATDLLNNNGTETTDKTASSRALETRAHIANTLPGLSDGSYATTQNTDAKQEEIIGKFINLTKVEYPNLYTVIAVGQTVKDVGAITKYRDLNNDGDYNDNNEAIATTRGQFDVNADEIIASAKIFARVRQYTANDTDSFYIQDMMYLDQ